MSFWDEINAQHKMQWKTYSLKQAEEICKVVWSLLHKNLLDAPDVPIAERIVSKLEKQTQDWAQMPFTLEEAAFLEMVHEGLWGQK